MRKGPGLSLGALNLAACRGALTIFVATPHSYAPSHPLMYSAGYRQYFLLIFIITVLFVLSSLALILCIIQPLLGVLYKIFLLHLPRCFLVYVNVKRSNKAQLRIREHGVKGSG
jgi:hypothetical protein